MHRKKKWIQTSVSYLMAGIILMIFLLLAVQSVFFIRKIILDFSRQDSAVVEDSSDSDIVRDSLRNEPERKLEPYRPLTEKRPISRERKKVEVKEQSNSVGKKYTPIQRKKRKILNLNTADSTDLLGLYGIGPYYAGKIIAYRERLGGSYASVYQLQEIWGIDSSRFAGLLPVVCVDTAEIIPLDLYTLSEDALERHPYIGKYAAKGVLRLRKFLSHEEFTVEALLRNGILTEEKARGLRLYCK